MSIHLRQSDMASVSEFGTQDRGFESPQGLKASFITIRPIDLRDFVCNFYLEFFGRNSVSKQHCQFSNCS
jgi:hypothetical protein